MSTMLPWPPLYRIRICHLRIPPWPWRLRIWLLIVASVSLGLAPSATLAAGWHVQYQIKGEWSDVNDALLEAIADRGMVVSYTSHIKQFLERTGPQLGIDEQPYIEARSHLFCKTDVSHAMVSEDPHAVGDCPYGFVIYELKEQPGVVYLSFRRHQHQRVLRLLEDIAAEVVE